MQETRRTGCRAYTVTPRAPAVIMWQGVGAGTVAKPIGARAVRPACPSPARPRTARPTGHRGRAILPGPQRACCRHALQPRRTGGVGCHACQCGSALSGRLRQVPRRDGRQVAALNERRVRSAGARRAVLAAAHGGLGSAPRVAPAAQ